MPTPDDFRTAAAYYISQGWAVFPTHAITADGQCTCGNPTCASPAKHPANLDSFKSATLDLDALFDFWPDFIIRNIAIATGRMSGLAVIDIDPRNGGDLSFEEFEQFHPEIDFETYTIRTGGGGVHLYFAVPPGSLPVPSVPNFLPGVDLKAEGGYVIAPPSSHPSGGTYSTINPAPLRPMPELLRVRPIQRASRSTGLAIPGTGLTAERQRSIFRDPTLLGPGERDVFFTMTARDLRRADVPIGDAVDMLRTVYERMHNPQDDYFAPEHLIQKLQRAYDTIEPEVTQETRAVVARLADAMRPTLLPATAGTPADAVAYAGPSAQTPAVAVLRPVDLPLEIWREWDGTLPDGWEPNDDGITRLALAQWRSILRYDRDMESWCAYNSSPGVEHWLTGKLGDERATQCMIATIHSIRAVIARDEPNPDVAAHFTKFAVAKLNDAPVRAALRYLAIHLGISHDDLDARSLALPVRNGVIDPTVLEPDDHDSYDDIPLHAHRPEDLFTGHANLVHLDYTSGLDEYWRAQLERWFPDPNVRDFVQRLMGYAVFGGGAEKLFVVALGKGDSGKSGFFDSMRNLLGRYAETINRQSITEAPNKGDANYDLAHISGTRLLIASETIRGARYDAGLIKILASGGGDGLRVRAMRKDFLTIHNRALLVIVTNNLPTHAQFDEALWNRTVILPFDGSFPRDDPNTLSFQVLYALIQQRSASVLQWIVEGYTNYQAGGLRIPERCLTIQRDIRQSEDWVSAYIDARLIPTGNPLSKLRLPEVDADYYAWAKAGGSVPVGPTALHALLAEHITKRRGTGGYEYFFGYSLRYPPDAIPASMNFTLPSDLQI